MEAADGPALVSASASADSAWRYAMKRLWAKSQLSATNWPAEAASMT
jgi:hypothetical protein